MGNSPSNIQQGGIDDFQWNPTKERSCVACNQFSNPELFTERVLSFFYTINEESTLESSSEKIEHKAEDLAQLLLGFYEEIDNIPQILETIIETDMESEGPVFKYLSKCFSNYLQTAENRTMLYNYNSYFSNKFFLSNEIQSAAPIPEIDVPSFSLLLTSLSISLSLLSDPNFPIQQLLPFSRFLINSNTSSGITPPSLDFLPSNQSHYRDLFFSAGFVNPHGVCTNGNFLFVLCSDNIVQIFPLLNSGTIGSMITADIGVGRFRISQKSSINASRNKLFIFNYEIVEYKYTSFDIDSIIQGQTIQPSYHNSNEAACEVSCSDGIVQVFIYSDHSFTVVDLLHNKIIGKSKFDESERQLPADLSTVIIETNGNFIGFILPHPNDNPSQPNELTYLVYSITGQFVKEELFYLNEQIIASCIDSINKCHWAIFFAGNSRFFIRRYAMLGGEDHLIFDIDKYTYPISPNPTPFSYFPILMAVLHRQLIGLINSQVTPTLFLAQTLDEFQKMIDLLQQIIKLPQESHQDKQVAAEQVLTILISLNLRRISCTSKPNDYIIIQIIQVIRVLPLNLATLLFFSNFDYLIHNSLEAPMLMIEILSQIQSEELIRFAFRQIELSGSIAYVRFTSSNGLFNLIPQDCSTIQNIGNNIFRFLLIHQRCLIRETEKFIKANPLVAIKFTYNNTDLNAFDLFGDYVQNLFSKFDKLVSMYSVDDILNSALFVLFSNFMNLLASLVEFHSVAQIATAMLSLVINKLVPLMKTNAKLIFMVIFIYGKFCATLLKGGGLSDIESKFLELIKANINIIDIPELINNLDSDEIESFQDERINLFLNGEGNSIDKIYLKIKPLVNRKLSNDIKQMDRLSLVAFSKHMDCVDEMLFFDGSKQPSPSLRMAFDQTIRVRNVFRLFRQNNKDTTLIKTRCLMLLRMNSANLSEPKILGDFVTSDIDPHFFTQIIMYQRKRIDTTFLGFSLLHQTYSMQVDLMIHKIIGLTLKEIKSFEGLSSIIQITTFNQIQEQQIIEFLKRVIESVKDNFSNFLVIVAYRFFRDLDNIANIQHWFLQSVLEVYKNMPNRYSLFALALSLMKGITSIPVSLLTEDKQENPFCWLLLYESMKYALPPKGFNIAYFVRSFVQSIWGSPIHEIRIKLRVLTSLCTHGLVSDPHTLFTLILKQIGDLLNNWENLDACSEYIYFLRRFLKDDKTPFKKLLITFMLNVNFQIDPAFILAVFSILGMRYENCRPYSVVNNHVSRNEMKHYYLIPNEKTQVAFYPRPFHLLSDRIEYIDNQDGLYSVPLIEVEPEDFPYFDFIQSFYLPISDCVYTTPIVYAMYMQTFASFSKNSQFVKQLNPSLIHKLYENPLSIHSIRGIWQITNMIKQKSIIPEICGFSIIKDDGNEYTTFLSPPLLTNCTFSITFELPNVVPNVAYVGIVSDNLEPYYTRYSLVSYPEGLTYPVPINKKITFSQHSTVLNMKVQAYERIFTIEKTVQPFPIGYQFRIIFSTKLPNYDNVKISIYSEKPVFQNTFNTVIEEVPTDYGRPLFQVPGWAMKFTLTKDISQLPDLPRIFEPCSEPELFRTMMIQPPNNIILHGLLGSHMSPPIFSALFYGQFRKIALQYSTIALIRIANIDVTKSYPVCFKLYRYLILLLESFSVPLSAEGMFPYEMSKPIWSTDVDPVYLSFENEAKKALTTIISDPKNVNKIAIELQTMANSKLLHSLMYPQKSLKYFPRAPPFIVIPPNQLKIICFNDFQTNNIPAVTIDKLSFKCPLIYTMKPISNTLMFTNQCRSTRSVCILTANVMNNNWVMNTPIELLLLLKNFTFIARQVHRPIIKQIIIDAFLIQSAIMNCYLDSFLDFVQLHLPSTPFDKNPEYLSHLALLGAFLKYQPSDPFLLFYQREQSLMANQIAAEIACHFHEFFSSPLPPPKSNTCAITPVIIDPGAITSDFVSHISTLRLFSKKYESLAGFPFWEILPYWIRLKRVGKESSDYQHDLIRPSFSRHPSMKHLLFVSNPSSIKINVRLVKLDSNSPNLSRDSILTYSNSETFEEQIMVDYQKIHDSIVLTMPEIYFSLISSNFDDPWQYFTLRLTEADPKTSKSKRQSSKRQSSKEIIIEPETIRNDFLNDMRQFAIEWRETDTNELLNIIPRDLLSNPFFESIVPIVKYSSFIAMYSETVVILRALLLHHYNYIHIKHHEQVPELLWKSFNSFLSIDIAAESLLKGFVTDAFNRNSLPKFEINRRKAHLIADTNGSPSDSIIAQLAKVVKKFGPTKFRMKEQPWFVSFTGEMAIDAGGPTRELIVEAVTSIFEPTTRLMTKVDASTPGESRYFYVPNENALDRLNEFFAVGVLIGIIIRTGLYQDLPFSIIVWKTLANEEITDDEVLQSDRLFKLTFKDINEILNSGPSSNELNINRKWTVESWSGTTIFLPNHNRNAFVERDQLMQYQRECLAYRKKSIAAMLAAMKDGFFANIGIKSHPLMKGSLLSRLAQGSGKISIDQMKGITEVIGFPDQNQNEYIQRFWRAASRLSESQVKLLFKFITSLTRIPNSTVMGKDFRIKIDPMQCQNPDLSLPTASTCFNRLHLPSYSTDEIAYEKISYAIQYCQTMESK